MHRPVAGFTLTKPMRSMAYFNTWYKGNLTLDITLLRKYSDERSVLHFSKSHTPLRPGCINYKTRAPRALTCFDVNGLILLRFQLSNNWPNKKKVRI